MSNYRHTEFFTSNDFDLLHSKIIGKGGYSVVYLANHRRTNKQYAIKCASKFKTYKPEKHSQSSGDEVNDQKNEKEVTKDISDKIRQEIDIMSKLRHRNIIQLKGWFEDEQNIYLVLPYVSGGDLSSFLKKGIPSKEETVKITTQLVSALKYCHRKGILHRDIKLNNILLDENLNIKLTDFGLSAIKDEANALFYDRVGTARYTAPEFLYKTGHNEKVDIWGLGIILFLLLTGKFPFNGSSKKSIYRRIKEKRIDYEEFNLSDDERHLLNRLLCKNPKYRIQLEHILDAEFFNY